MYKRATFSHKCKVTALNNPKGKGWDIYNLPNQIKTASTTVEGEDLNGFDLKKATKDHPDHLYIKVFAIKKDEPNDNGDAFNEKELKTAAPTFVGVPLFTNHQNDDVEKARGECVHSWYDEKEGGIYIIGRVDKLAYPRLARGIEEGYITGCFPPDAPVLMADGTEKNICDIEDGDEVISGKGNIKKVLGIRQRGYNYPIVSIQLEGNKQPLVCTSHHNLMVYRLPELCACGCEEELVLKKDKRITSKTFNRKFKTGHNSRGESEKFNHEYIQKIKACELEDGDFLVEPKFVDDSCDKYVTEDEAFLIGLFLAEGSFEKRKGIRHSAIFNFAHTERDTLAFQCEEKLKSVFATHRNGPTTNYYPGASQTRVNLYGKDIADWFYDRCGEYSDGKILNEKLMKLGKEKTSSLLAGFIEGDGYKVKEKYYGFGIVSSNLTSQLRLLFEKIGVRTNYKVITEDNGRWGYKPVHEVTFGKTTVPDLFRDRLIYKKAEKAKVAAASWHSLEDYTLRRVKEIKEIDYDGIVYDIEVEDDHTYCVNHIAVSNTSMGCSVENSICSVCHNNSNTSEDYCLEGNSPILMSDFTIKSIKDIKVGDEVIDAYGKKTKVTELFKREIDEKISILKSRCIDGELLATKNHPFLVNRRGEYKYIPSEYMDDNETLFMPIPQIKKDNYFFEKFGFDYLSYKDKKRLVAFLGYYAAEGSRIKKDGKIKALELTFHEEEEDYVEEIRNICIDIFKKDSSIYRNESSGHTIRVRLWKPEIAERLYKMCPGIVHREQSKKFDESVFTLSDEFKVELLRAFIDGDGHCDSRNIIQVVSACPSLSSQILYLILSLKSSPSFNSYKNCGGPFNRDKESVSYRISISVSQLKTLANKGVKCTKAATKVITQSKLTNAITKDELFAKHNAYCIEEVDYKGFVYNFETESHSYVANNTSVHNCSHVANRKNRKYTGDLKCSYHNSPTDKKDKCPICGSTKEDVKTLKHSEQSIFEHNYGLKFIENSFVVNPACHDCGVRCVLHAPTLESKVASFNKAIGNLVKEAHLQEEDNDIIVKLGGVQELESLKHSMTEMETVVKSMLKQKENISMEYVSDLVKAMADVQGIFDELTEMGYGALPSPAITATDNTNPIVADQFPDSLSPEQMAAQQAPPPPAGSQTSDLGGLGNITMPKNSLKKIKDFSKISQTLINKVNSLDESLHILNKNINSRLDIGAKMAIDNKTTKVAAGTDNLEVITEKQLSKESEPLHPRTEEVYEGITESKEQIGGSEQSNDTTSASPQVRTGTYDTITEDQLKTQSALGDAVIHYSEYPDVITEKQWTDFSKDVAGNLSGDYTESITEAQIRDLLSSHKFIGNIETITEDQLKNISMTDGLKRWANKNYSVSLVKVATNILADMIATYRKSPAEIKRVSSVVSDDIEIKSKVAFLAVLNSLPHKKDNREAVASNASYFAKTASSNSLSTLDSLIMSAASNAKFGMKAEDVLDTVSHVINNSTQMTKVNSIVESKMNKVSDKNIVTKADAFASAIKELDKPEDGKYQIRATMEDIGVPITDKVAFVEGVKKFAQEIIDDDSVASAVIKIEVGDSGELIIDIQDGASEEITPDDIGDLIEGPVEDIDADMNGENLDEECEECPIEEEDDVENCMASAKKEIKTAQMMGGEMGGQGGAAQTPGAGATLPGTPGVGAPPMESFTEEPGLEEEGGLEDNLEPLPPGSICPVCGSDDVNVLDGKGQCGNCASEMTYKVEVNVTKWQGVTPSEEAGEEEVEEGFEGEGFEMPTEESLGTGPGAMEQEMGEIPAAASVSNDRKIKFAATVKLLPKAVKKVAEAGLKVGSISPATGKSNTVKLEGGEYICLDTGTKYKVSYMVSKDAKQVYAQWEWSPRTASTICPSCDRAKQKFVKALSSIKITEADFDKMELEDKVGTIIKLKQAGALKTIKTASKEGSVLKDYKLAYGGYGKKFPIESCIEKLARRFGENAVCLSGPDEGKPLAESICNRLKKADIYTSKIASKLADSWSDCDGDEECITHQVRSGYSLRQAAEVCSTLKIAVAEGEDFLTDELAGEDTFNNTPDMDPDVPVVEEVDPFDNVDDTMEEEHGATVTLELPIDIVEQLEQAIEVAEGEGQEGIEEEMGEGEIIDEAPIDNFGEESPIDDIGGDAPIEEAIGPDELNDCSGGEMKPVEDPGMGVEMKEENTGFEQEQTSQPGLEEKNRGISEQPSKVNVTVNGQPINNPMTAKTKTETKEAFVMENNVGKVGKTQMDLSGVINAINKIAGEKEISQSKAQDSKDIGTYTAGEGGSLMGHESDTIRTPQKPSVPRDNATMGQEPTDLNPQDKPQPVIPSDNATMGHEEEAGLSGGDNTYTGGDKGQGKTELASVDNDLYHMKGFGSSKEGISSLADRIAKKLAPKEPVAKDPDIQPISDGGTIGKEEKLNLDEPTDVEGSATESLMGHEKETIGDAPKSPADHPDVNTGNAQMGKEELDSEKTVKDKGTVIANSDSESEAIRVAGRMLQAEQIQASELSTKINELKSYKPAQIKDIEKAIFAKKGLDTVSDGMSQTVQINEASSVRNAKDDLSTKLLSLFTLDKQNKDADNDDLAQLRKTYGK